MHRPIFVVVWLCAVAQVTVLAQDLSPLQVWIEQGQRALDEGRYRAAFDAFAAGAFAHPKDVALYVSAAHAASLLGRQSDAERWLERALQIEPAFTPASLLLGQVLVKQGRLLDAVAVLERAAVRAPADVRVMSQLEAWREEARSQSRLFESRSTHFAVLFDGPADARVARTAIDVLEHAYYRVGAVMLAYPPSTTVVLSSRQQFRDVTRSPAWAGGVFDGRIRLPAEGALERPDEFRRVLEHEFVHVVVSTLAGAGVPRWLHEGLAMTLEPGGGAWGLELLTRTSQRVDVFHLLSGFEHLGAHEASLAYAQSVSAVKAMVARAGMPAVVGLLRRVGEGETFPAAFEATMGVSLEAFQRRSD